MSFQCGSQSGDEIHACLSACLAESLEGPSTNSSALMKSYKFHSDMGKKVGRSEDNYEKEMVI